MPSDQETRNRSHYSAEPGEIMSKPDNDWHMVAGSDEYRRLSLSIKGDDTKDKENYTTSPGSRQTNGNYPKDEESRPKESNLKKRKRPHLRAVRFALPPKAQAAPDQDWDSDDDDEDMSDYFAMQIEKTEAVLSTLQKPILPMEVVAHYAAISHGAMVKILNEGDDLEGLLGKVPEQLHKSKKKIETTPTPASSIPAPEVTLPKKEVPARREDPVAPKETPPAKDSAAAKETLVVKPTPKEPASKEPRELALKEPKESVSKGLKEPASKESKEPAFKESKEVAPKGPKEPTSKEPKESASKELIEPIVKNLKKNQL
uniref:Uncharacterized protein n=1 Tax=Bionectria ochroleuca TaxID=29856 RepID=A0A8H7NDD5_BIOOC